MSSSRSPPSKSDSTVESGELNQSARSEEKEVKSSKNRERRRERSLEKERKDQRSPQRTRKRSRSYDSDRKERRRDERRRDRDESDVGRRDRRRSRSGERRRRRSRSNSVERDSKRPRERYGDKRRRRPRSPVRPKPPTTIFKKNAEATTSEESVKLEQKEMKWSTRIAAVASDDSQRSKFEKLLGMHKKPSDEGNLKLNKVNASDVKDLKSNLQKMTSELDQQFEHGRQFTHYNRGRGFGI